MNKYVIKWTQPYVEWERFAESFLEALLENSDYSESNAVIAHIKGL